MLKTMTNRETTVKHRSEKATKMLAAFLLLAMSTVLFSSCKAANKNKPSLNTTETTETTDESFGGFKGVVISGRETEPAETTTETTVETTAPTETAAPTETTEEPTETTKPNTPTKAPAKKPKSSPKTTTKKKTKKSSKKKSTKKPSSSSASNQYSYCTCDAKVSYGVAGMGSSGTHTFTGLTAQRTLNGSWKLTSASASQVVTWLNKNVKDKIGKPNWGSYSATITNTRNLRNSP